MLKEKRLQTIMEILQKDGMVQSSELCKMFGVTNMTIRRDLDTLAENESIIRTHGGAVYNTDAKLVEPPYANRLNEHLSTKETIATKALEFIARGQHVFLDSGTTTLHLAKQLTHASSNIFITNGINIASELMLYRDLSVILVGGDLDSNSLSTRGVLAEKQLNNFRVDVAFLGCNAISPEGDVLVGNLTETGLKQQAMKIANSIYLLVDSSKFNHYSLISYASVKDFTGVITDSNLPEYLQNQITEAGGKLYIAKSFN